MEELLNGLRHPFPVFGHVHDLAEEVYEKDRWDQAQEGFVTNGGQEKFQTRTSQGTVHGHEHTET
jgi:hypothetical protein